MASSNCFSYTDGEMKGTEAGDLCLIDNAAKAVWKAGEEGEASWERRRGYEAYTKSDFE